MTQRVVIVGAGFGGMAVAQHLVPLLPADECEIVVIDQNDFSLFTPMLTEVVGGEVDAEDIVASIRSLTPRVNFQKGRITTLDAQAKTVTMLIGDEALDIPLLERTLEADQLVIALGSETNFHGIPGLQDHALTIKSVGDAASIHRRAIALLERSDEEGNAQKRRSLLTFVVGGGGFSGVETVAALNDLVRDLVKRFPNVGADEVRTILVQPGERILPELTAGLAKYAHQKLTGRGVEIRLSTEVTGMGSDYVELRDSRSGRTEQIAAYTCVWAGGVKPNPVIDAAHVRLGHHHGIVVDPCCRVADHPGVWALGDCAEIPKPDQKGTYAPTAQNAIREGAQVARNITATLRGDSPEPFRYHPIGELAIVGRRSGVASVYGVNVSGIAAWAMWRVVYLLKLPTNSQRVRIASHWLMDLAFGRPTVASVMGGDGLNAKAERAA